MGVKPIRSQIEQARRQYLAHRYPGNLADELLAPRRSRMRLVLASAALTGLAAALALWIGVHTGPRSTSPPVAMAPAPAPAPETTHAPPDQSQTASSVSTEFTSIPPMPSLPGYFEISPPSLEGLTMPAIPGFPDYEAFQPSERATTQETA